VSAGGAEALEELLLARAGRRGIEDGAAVALDYGDVAAEWKALDEGVGLAGACARRLIEVTGEERAEFLHGQVTAAVKGLAPGSGAAAAVLTAQGRALGLFAVYAEDDHHLIATDAATSATVREALERFLVADDCEFEDLEPTAALVLVGPAAPALVAALALLRRGDLRVPSIEIVATDPAASLAPLVAELEARGASLVGRDALEILRVESGRAAYGRDVDEGRLVVEARLEWAIHFNKGCYVGQEVVERAVSRGRLNHLLSLVSASEADLARVKVGDRIEGGGEADVVTSLAVSPRLGAIALAYVDKDQAAAGTTLSILSGEGPVAATVLAWPRERRLAGRERAAEPGATNADG
jgi:folate-binding protein YgfZ